MSRSIRFSLCIIREIRLKFCFHSSLEVAYLFAKSIERAARKECTDAVTAVSAALLLRARLLRLVELQHFSSPTPIARNRYRFEITIPYSRETARLVDTGSEQAFWRARMDEVENRNARLHRDLAALRQETAKKDDIIVFFTRRPFSKKLLIL